jgi:hypothetical protein
MKNMKMKKFETFIGSICLMGLLLSGCDDMDSNYKEFVENGPVIYMGRIQDTIKVVSGRNRVKLSWPAHYDPRVKYAEIFWLNDTKSRKIPMAAGLPTEYMLEGLNEGSYIFNLFFCDDAGNKSISTLLTGEVYGRAYESILLNCKVASTSLAGNHLTLTFSHLGDRTAKGVNVIWKERGVLKSRLVEYPETSITLENYTGEPVNYCTAYKPVEDCIDYFYSDTAACKFSFEPGDVTCVNPDSFGSIDQLFDGIENDANNYFGTLPSGRPGYIPLPHNIDFKLPGEIKKFSMRYVLRKDNPEWYPTSIELLASSDGANWVSVAQLDNLPTDNNASYVSGIVTSPVSAKHIRVSTKAINGSLGAVQFAEMEFYPVIGE